MKPPVTNSPARPSDYPAFAAATAVKDEVAFGDDTTIFKGGAANVSLLHDTTAPTLSSATIDEGGDVLTLTFSKIVHNPNTGFTINATNGAVTLAPITTQPDILNTFRFLTSRSIQATETVTVSYSGGTVRDNANNPLAAIVAAAVTNNSTEADTAGNLIFQDDSDLLLHDAGVLEIH